MEQKRRTINSGRKKGSDAKKIWTVIAIILGLALIFYVSFKLSYGLFSPGNDEAETTQSTEEDIANMSREELENKYTELKKTLEDKEKEIEMLKERLENSSESDSQSVTENDDAANTQNDRPESKSPATDSGASSSNNASSSGTQSQAPASPAPAPAEPFSGSGELISPDDLAALDQAASR